MHSLAWQEACVHLLRPFSICGECRWRQPARRLVEYRFGKAECDFQSAFEPACSRVSPGRRLMGLHVQIHSLDFEHCCMQPLKLCFLFEWAAWHGVPVLSDGIKSARAASCCRISGWTRGTHTVYSCFKVVMQQCKVQVRECRNLESTWSSCLLC